MAEVKSTVADWLGKIGKKVFGFLSRCEDRKIIPGVSGWIKTGVLGLLVTVIASLSAREEEDLILCYKPTHINPYIGEDLIFNDKPMPIYPYVSDAQLTPNPTAGAEEVILSAFGRIHNDYVGNYTIDSAYCILGTDTIPLMPVDTMFGDTAEHVLARLCIADQQPGTTRVNIIVVDNYGTHGDWTEELIITGADEVNDDDHTEEKEN